ESAGELVQKLNDEAMRLEKSPGDAETARSLRRTVHTLKGDAAACGFRELSELSHEFEDVLTLGNTAAAASVPEIALRAADVFAALLEAYRKGTKLPGIQSLRADIARLASSAPDGAPKTKKRKAAAKTSRWSEYEQLAIARAVAEGKRAHHVHRSGSRLGKTGGADPGKVQHSNHCAERPSHAVARPGAIVPASGGFRCRF